MCGDGGGGGRVGGGGGDDGGGSGGGDRGGGGGSGSVLSRVSVSLRSGGGCVVVGSGFGLGFGVWGLGFGFGVWDRSLRPHRDLPRRRHRDPCERESRRPVMERDGWELMRRARADMDILKEGAGDWKGETAMRVVSGKWAGEGE